MSKYKVQFMHKKFHLLWLNCLPGQVTVDGIVSASSCMEDYSDVTPPSLPPFLNTQLQAPIVPY